MMSITSTRYLSNVDWLQDVVQGTDLILCGVSALEYLELFNGYVNESKIQVYAQNEGQFDNIEYHIVNSFDDIEYLNFDGVLWLQVVMNNDLEEGTHFRLPEDGTVLKIESLPYSINN